MGTVTQLRRPPKKNTGIGGLGLILGIAIVLGVMVMLWLLFLKSLGL